MQRRRLGRHSGRICFSPCHRAGRESKTDPYRMTSWWLPCPMVNLQRIGIRHIYYCKRQEKGFEFEFSRNPATERSSDLRAADRRERGCCSQGHYRVQGDGGEAGGEAVEGGNYRRSRRRCQYPIPDSDLGARLLPDSEFREKHRELSSVRFHR